MQYIEGIIQIANVFLAIIAGIVAVSFFHISHRTKILQSWRPLIAALVFFAVEEFLGALRSFKIYETPHLTHIIPSIILGLLIYAIAHQIYIRHSTRDDLEQHLHHYHKHLGKRIKIKLHKLKPSKPEKKKRK